MIAKLQTGNINSEPVRSLPIDALPTSENGWPPRPFQIVSLLDVTKFPAEQFIKATALLISLSTVKFEEAQHFTDLSEEGQQGIRKQVGLIRSLCEIMGFGFAIDEIDHLTDTCIDQNGELVRMTKLFESLVRRFHDEMKRVECVFLPASDLKYFNQDALFGVSVATKFPTAEVDIKAAGNCYATDNATGCVMHSMRVLELGISALAKQFRVSFQHTNWDKIIGQIEKKIRAIESKKRKPKNWRDDRQFYSEAAIHFRFLKDAWRNYAMHVHENYDKASALTIMNHTHEFMLHLSERLGE